MFYKKIILGNFDQGYCVILSLTKNIIRFIFVNMFKILIIDDEEGMLHFLKRLFEFKNYSVFTFTNGYDGLNFLENNEVDAIILDVKLPDLDGLEVLKSIKQRGLKTPVIIITAYGDIDSAVEFMKIGAYDYVTKPFPKEKILEVVKNACEKYLLEKENKSLKHIIKLNFSFQDIIYKSKIMESVINLAKNVAPSDSTVLISGESGTGKELIARLIHNFSNRKNKIFFPINCASITDTLFESQLFGYVKGSFTGAYTSNKGILKEINGGTLFLDEISEIPINMQAKFLRLIQYKEFIPIGSNKIESTDLRFIIATNKNLEEEVKKGNFREDLFYRINVITINLPPLRERKEDIEPLVEFFISKYSKKFNKKINGIDEDALKILKRYSWPGNVRELENLIERAVILAKNSIITLNELPKDLLGNSFENSDNILSLDEVVKHYIKKVYILCGKNKLKTAEILKISRKTLDRKLKDLNV